MPRARHPDEPDHQHDHGDDQQADHRGDPRDEQDAALDGRPHRVASRTRLRRPPDGGAQRRPADPAVILRILVDVMALRADRGDHRASAFIWPFSSTSARVTAWAVMTPIHASAITTM